MKISAPLTKVQYGIYIECMNHQGELCYNIPYLYIFDSRIDTIRFCNATKKAILAHPTLFTQIELDDKSEPIQVINEEYDFDLEVIELNDEATQESDYGWFKKQIRPFNILGNRLFHIGLYKDDKHHYLLWDCHHLINDGTSMQILLHDIDSAYNGNSLTKEDFTLAAIANEEAEIEESPEYEEARKWYHEHFDCSDVVTQLIPDSEEETKSERFIERTLGIPLQQVEDFCQSNGIFKNTLFTTAYAYLLSVYNNEQQALTRTVYNGRTDKRLTNSTGMYVRTIPVYCQYDDNTTTLMLLQKLQEQIAGCRQHKEYSYMDVINDLHLESNNTFVWHGMLFSDMELMGYPMQTVPLINDKEEDKLYIKAYILDNHLCVRAEYDSNEYSDELINQFIESYETVISGFITQPLLGNINIVSKNQLQKLDSFNNNPLPYDKNETIVSLFAKQASTFADKTAVVYKEKKYTYRDVDRLSDNIAAFILSKGLKSEQVVSILIPRCEWMAIASLGVLKAGCAYQPLDPTYPKERLLFMMQDADAKLLIADRELYSKIDEWTGDVFFTDEIGTLHSSAGKTSICLPEISPSALFILLYTSGSTGTPKGVMIEHRNMTAFCNMHCKNSNLNSESHIGAYASFGFDASVMEIWSPLICGASLYIIPEDMRLDLIRLNDYFESNGITHTFMTTQVARQFVNDIENHSLKSFMTGGEKLADVKPSTFTLYNGYGPTESICYVTSFMLDKSYRNIPIGKAVDNMHLYIVDKFGRRLPAGAAGELWVSGPQVSRGYLNRPEKTAEVYISNPFDTQSPYDRIYRTGDIVRYLPDGTLQYVGRQDGQVKIRGFRIELKEVEGIIRQFPGIKDVTVQAFDEAGGGKFIAAYVVSDEQIDTNALAQFIMEEKPPYMVPAATMQIDKIPLNQNQKVDKRALPKPVKSAPSSDTASATPLNILEQELKTIISDIIKTDDFLITDILGFIGLTSISAIKLATAIYKKYGVTIDSKSLVKSGTLQSIENEIISHILTAPCQHSENTTETETSSAIQYAPLSYAQTGVYIECMKLQSSTVYNIPSVVRFPLSIDTTTLKKAVETVISMHPQLFVHFESNENGIVQVYTSKRDSHVTLKETTEQAFNDYKHEFVQPFNLNQGPLYRAEIIKTEDNIYLLLDVHHLVFDGGSFDIFMHELCATLNNEKIEAEDLDYAHYIKLEKESEKSEEYIKARNFFAQSLGQLEGSTELEPDLTNVKPTGSTESVFSPFNLSDVDVFCRQHSITAAHLTLAAVFYTLSRFTNSEQVCITTISNGRSNLRIANTIGMFVNTLALSATISDQPVINFIRDVSERFDNTLQHENYPFAQIAADYDLTADIMFAYQIGVISNYQYDGKQLQTENLEIDTPKFHVAFYIKEENGKAGVLIEYDNGRYSAGMMQELATSIVNVITSFISRPTAILTDVSLLNSKQRELLDSFNNTDIPYDESETIVSLFETQVKKTPDNIAVVYHDVRLTYRQVDDLSDRIASYLISRELKSEDVVSILIPRCEWMVVASLGALKAGCAYQPLDPSYPQDRLTFMMQDANAKLLIADRELHELVNEWEGNILFTDEITNIPSASKESISKTDILPESLFILLYTSGSTGLPKGCQLEHKNLVAFCHWYQRYYQLSDSSRVAAYASYGFDACMMDMYPALTCGAAVYIIGDDIRLDLPDLNTYFEAEGITHSFITTQVGYQFATNFKNNSLLHLSVGGEKLAAINPPEGYKLHNGYGPTECTIFTTTYCVDKYEHNIPIGKPVDNMRLYIVDKQGNRLPVGAAGELWASGPQISRGYLNRPDKTAEVYIKNPFTDARKYQHIYRTGDIVRYLPDGNIQFVGRRDGQVKVRGFRIELKEVESVIRQFPGIKDATVQAFDYETGGKYIAAYIVSDENIDIKALNQFILQQKPSYMVPASTMQLKSIPLNQNQKVNRKALPTPVIQHIDREYVAPKNDVEKFLCDVFSSILGDEKISTSDNFFDLGGTSLMVTRIVIEVSKAGYNITYGDIFKYKTPAAIAQFIAGEQSSNTQSATANSLASFDYTAITKLLKANTLQAFNPEKSPLGNVMITGSTGYLGIHVLHELISHEDVSLIVCLVRAVDQKKAERRLRSLLFYYFDNQYASLFDKRIHVVLGDVTQPFHIPYHIDTVFNCAANVKHFSKGTDIEDVNIGGTDNCIEFCLQNHARLIHVSTYSTAGTTLPNTGLDHPVFNEQTLFWGQSLENKYAWSKFIAERNVLDAMANKGLRAKIMRAGNIAARSTDGEFQMNFQSNAFMGRLRVYQMIGALPYSQFDNTVEFSPVNETARAIVLLSQTPDACCLFHTFNHHKELLGDILERMSYIDINIPVTTDEEFSSRMEEAQKDPQKAERMAGMIAYMNMSHGQTLITPDIVNHQTMQILYRLGFRWNITTWDYIERMLYAINGLGFFNN